MRLLLLLTISSLGLIAQSTVPSAKFDPSQFNKALGLDSHVHPFGKCEGAPDGVYMRGGTSYYACVKGKNVCNKDPGEIPAHLMRAFDVPHSRVSGDYEKFSYLLQSGKTFSLEFEAGRVAQIRTVTPN